MGRDGPVPKPELGRTLEQQLARILCSGLADTASRRLPNPRVALWARITGLSGESSSPAQAPGNAKGSDVIE
jgi:hypothetical protein